MKKHPEIIEQQLIQKEKRMLRKHKHNKTNEETITHILDQIRF